MTLAHLIWGSFFSCMLGFLLGFWRGRKDLRADLDPIVDEMQSMLEAIPTTCAECNAPLKARCSAGCAPRPPIGGGA